MGKKNQVQRPQTSVSAKKVASGAAFFEERRGGFLLFIHLQPKASRSQIVGLHDRHLKIALPAPPVDGKANAALLAFLAECLGCAKQDLQIVRGLTSRKKVVHVMGVARENLSDLLPKAAKPVRTEPFPEGD